MPILAHSVLFAPCATLGEDMDAAANATTATTRPVLQCAGNIGFPPRKRTRRSPLQVDRGRLWIGYRFSEPTGARKRLRLCGELCYRHRHDCTRAIGMKERTLIT